MLSLEEYHLTLPNLPAPKYQVIFSVIAVYIPCLTEFATLLLTFRVKGLNMTNFRGFPKKQFSRGGGDFNLVNDVHKHITSQYHTSY